MTGRSAIPDSTTAICVTAPGEHDLVEVEVPRPREDEVVIQVANAGICGSDRELLAGNRPDDFVTYPVIPGHEWAGTIVDAGERVTRLRAGQRVVAEGIRYCGTCERCREGSTNLCEAGYDETGFTRPGAFSGYVTIPARYAHLLPDDADLLAAALLEPTSIVMAGLLQALPPAGSSVVIIGSGTLGLIAVQAFRLHRPTRLVVLDRRADRLELAERLGATETRAIEQDEGLPEDLTGAADIVFEAAGSTNAVRGALEAARRGGTVVLAGVAGSDEPAVSADTFSLRALHVHGIFGAPSRAWQQAVRLFSNGLLDLRCLVSHQFSISEYQEAFDVLENRPEGSLKITLHPDNQEVG